MTIDLMINNQVVATTSGGTFSLVWDSTSVANGMHTLTVMAYGPAGNANLAAVSVTVSN